ncbi:MAG: hypothetical protein HN411_00250, partial [Waddliaceae bacterium]|nr:hypothetical protein [Waddliaceae bacterium]
AAPSKAEMHDTPKTPLPSGVAVHSGETKDPKIIASAAPAASAEALKTFGKTLVTALDKMEGLPMIFGKSVGKKLLSMAQSTGTSEKPQLIEAIEQRRSEIAGKIEEFRPKIEEARHSKDSMHTEFESVLATGTLERTRGAGGAYILKDEAGVPQFIVKPNDEDLFCLNNTKGCSSPFLDTQYRARNSKPLYTSVQTAACCYDFAKMAGVDSITPRIAMMIIKSDAFHDVSDPSTTTKSADGIREKLCSVQRFIPNARDLNAIDAHWDKKGFSEDEQEALVDQKRFEDINILTWITGDSDGHFENILIGEQQDEKGETSYPISRVDFDLSFMEKNLQYRNDLSLISSHCDKPLSSSGREKIMNLSATGGGELLDSYGLSGSKQAFEKRIKVLHDMISNNPSITITAINERMYLLSTQDPEAPLKSYEEEQIKASGAPKDAGKGLDPKQQIERARIEASEQGLESIRKKTSPGE